MPGDTRPPPFVFPLDAERWPVHDPDAGVAFPKGGMHGAFHAGVVHAFVISGYYPEQIGASSMGSWAAVALATAADLDDQALRRELVDDLLQVWLANPGRAIWSRVWGGGPLAELMEELGGLSLSLESLGRLGWQLWRGSRRERLAAAMRLWWLLPWTRRGLRARLHLPLAATGALFRSRHEGGGRELAFAVGQALLDAYGMRESLLGTSPGDEGFFDLLARWLPPGEGPPRELGDFRRSRLTIQLTNLRVARELDADRSDLTRRPVVVLRDGDGARLLGVLRAATSLQPMHPAVPAREVFGEALPEGLQPDDPLVDSSYIATLPVARMVEAWKEQGTRGGPKRLFAVYSDPLLGAPPADTGFFASGLHDLYLLRQRDQHYDLTVTRLVTELLRVSPEAPEELILVDPEPIAPHESLGFMQVSVPRDEEVLAAVHSGCRSTLETLHAETLRELAGEGEAVHCPRLLARLRERSSAPSGYFEGLPRACAGCPGRLEVPARPREAPVAELRPEDRLADLVQEPGDPVPEATPVVLVPAGGAFLGVFHVGALVALRDHGVAPHLYAGASVGTMFSMLLQAGLAQDRVDPGVIDRMLDVDRWVDRPATPPRAGGTGTGGGEPEGRVDRLVARFAARLRDEAVRPLLELGPRGLVRLGQGGGHLSPDAHRRLCEALAALFFPRATGPTGAVTEALEGEEARRELQRLLAAVRDLDLPVILEVADRIARHAGVVEPGREHEAELIGFDQTERLLRDFAFEGGEVPRLEEVGGEGSHFLFTVTNHSTGREELFGGPPDALGSLAPGESPWAIQGVLAGSSLPLAFRRRSRAEVLGPSAVPGPDPVYSDGGIFNNFPVDAALRYLRFLSAHPEYAWLGERPVRVLLMPLDFPEPPRRPSGGDPGLGCLEAAALSWRQGTHDKLLRVLLQQALVRRLAGPANAALRALSEETGEGRRQAVRADFDLLAPARKVYAGGWAFKRWLGFSPEGQLELLAQGCRRSRYALLFREWREGRQVTGRAVDLETFDAEVRAEERSWKDRPGEHCVLGRLNPRRCGLLDIDPTTGAQVRRACAATCLEDLPPRDLPRTSRVDVWVKLLEEAEGG